MYKGIFYWWKYNQKSSYFLVLLRRFLKSLYEIILFKSRLFERDDFDEDIRFYAPNTFFYSISFSFDFDSLFRSLFSDSRTLRSFLFNYSFIFLESVIDWDWSRYFYWGFYIWLESGIFPLTCSLTPEDWFIELFEFIKEDFSSFFKSLTYFMSFSVEIFCFEEISISLSKELWFFTLRLFRILSS